MTTLEMHAVPTEPAVEGAEKNDDEIRPSALRFEGFADALERYL